MENERKSFSGKQHIKSNSIVSNIISSVNTNSPRILKNQSTTNNNKSSSELKLNKY